MIELTVRVDEIVLANKQTQTVHGLDSIELGKPLRITVDTNIYTGDGIVIEIRNPQGLVVERTAKRHHTHILRIRRE